MASYNEYVQKALADQRELYRHIAKNLSEAGVHGHLFKISPDRVMLATDASISVLFSLKGFIRPSGRWRLILPSKDTKPPVVIRLDGKFVWSNSSRKNVFRVDYLDVRWVHPPTNNVNDLKPVTPRKATIRTF